MGIERKMNRGEMAVKIEKQQGRIAQLQAENKRLKEALEKIRDDWKTKNNPSERSYCHLATIAKLTLREKPK